MSKELQRKLDKSLGTLLLRCRDRVLELAQTDVEQVNHLNLTSEKRGASDVLTYKLPNMDGGIEVATSGQNSDSYITYTLNHCGTKVVLTGIPVGSAYTELQPYMQWELEVHDAHELFKTSHRVAADEFLGNSLAILLYTAHQRNVETTLNAQISFIELLTKSMEK